MKKQVWILLCALIVLTASKSWAADEPAATTTAVPAAAVVADEGQAAYEAIRAGVEDKVKQSGTLDIYDDTIKKARNLQTMDFPKAAEKTDKGYAATITYRDIKSGDVVKVEATAVLENAAWTLSGLTIKEVKPLEKADAKKEITDADVQTYMKEYLAAQVKFTDSMMLFDEDKNAMRKLKLQKLDEAVRHLGIFSISRAEFLDSDSGEIVGVDISVVNKDGALSVDALRIRDVKKAKP